MQALRSTVLRDADLARSASRSPRACCRSRPTRCSTPATWGSAMPSIRGPLEPIIIGVWRAGLGSSTTSSARVERAVERHPLAGAAAPRMIANASSNRDTRLSYGMPNASNSRRFQPEPEPEHEAPAADLVDRRRHLRQHRRRVKAGAGHQRPDPHRARSPRRARSSASTPPTAPAPARRRAGGRRARPTRTRPPRPPSPSPGTRASAPRARPREAECRSACPPT